MPNLPAPYVSPWKEFARNLRALWADLGLRGRELWRRNREGNLSIPAFWPEELAAWFWPAVVALVLAALVAIAIVIKATPRQQASSPPPPPVPTSAACSARSSAVITSPPCFYNSSCPLFAS